MSSFSEKIIENVNAFIHKLDKSGLTVDVEDRIYIHKFIFDYIEGKIKNNTVLKLKLTALIAQSKTEQIEFSRLFDNELKLILDQITTNNNNKGGGEVNQRIDDENPKNKWQKFIEWVNGSKKQLILILSLITYILTMFLIRHSHTILKNYKINHKETHFVVNQSVDFEIYLEELKYSDTTVFLKLIDYITFSAFKYHYDKYDTINNTKWKINNHLTKTDLLKFQYTFKDTGFKYIELNYKTRSGEVKIIGDTIFICDTKPIIQTNEERQILGKVTSFYDRNLNSLGTIIWTIDNDKIIKTKDKKLNYKFQSEGIHTILARYEDQICNHDSRDINELEVEIKPKSDFWIENNINIDPDFEENKIKKLSILFWIIISGLILLSILFGFVRYFWNRISQIPFINDFLALDYINTENRKKIKQELSDIGKLDQRPYQLEFPSQNSNIDFNSIRGILNLSTTYLDESQKKLNISHSIKKTIDQLGFFTPIYQDKKKKTSYVFLIDDSYSHQLHTQFFLALIPNLCSSQIDYAVYYYFNDPNFIYTDKNKTEQSISSIKDLARESILIVFSNGINFLADEELKLDPQTSSNYRIWSQRILVSPLPYNDWSINEKCLQTFFKIIPADLVGLLDLVEIINKTTQQISLSKDHYNRYSVKYKVLNDIDELRLYINNDTYLMRWMLALAVYPRISWELILIIGACIEKNRESKLLKKEPKLLTYENLLKIVRIDWIRESYISSRWRLDLLKNLDIDTELKVREDLISVLDSVFSDTNYISNKEKEIQLTINKFILYANNPTKYPNYQLDHAKFIELYKNSKRDIEDKKKEGFKTLEITEQALLYYLEKHDPDYPINNSSEKEKKTWDTPVKLNGKNVSIEKYNTHLISSQENKNNKIKKWLTRLVVVSTILLLSFITYSYYSFKNGNPNSYLFELISETIDDLVIDFKYDDCLKKFNPKRIEVVDVNDKIIRFNFDSNTFPIRIDKLTYPNIIYNTKLKLYNYRSEVLETNLNIESNMISIQGLYCKDKDSLAPLVYLQYNNPSLKDSMDLLQIQLNLIKFNTPGIELVNKPFISEIRYFDDKMKLDAEKVGDEVFKLFGQRLKIVKLIDKKAKPNQIEVWVNYRIENLRISNKYACEPKKNLDKNSQLKSLDLYFYNNEVSNSSTILLKKINTDKSKIYKSKNIYGYFRTENLNKKEIKLKRLNFINKLKKYLSPDFSESDIANVVYPDNSIECDYKFKINISETINNATNISKESVKTIVQNDTNINLIDELSTTCRPQKRKNIYRLNFKIGENTISNENITYLNEIVKLYKNKYYLSFKVIGYSTYQNNTEPKSQAIKLSRVVKFWLIENGIKNVTNVYTEKSLNNFCDFVDIEISNKVIK